MFRKIDVRIWNDQKFRSLPYFGREIFIKLLLHPNLTPLGMLKMKKGALVEEIVEEFEVFSAYRNEIQEGFDKLVELSMIDYDETGLIAVNNFIKYNPPDNPNVVKGWKKCRNLLPECDLFWSHCLRLRQHCLDRGQSYVIAFDNAFPELVNSSKKHIEASLNKAEDAQHPFVEPYIASRQKESTTIHIIPVPIILSE